MMKNMFFVSRRQMGVLVHFLLGGVMAQKGPVGRGQEIVSLKNQTDMDLAIPFIRFQ